MHQLIQQRFKIFHPRFFEEVFTEKMIENYRSDTRKIGNRFYALPNLFWGNSESAYVHDYDLLKQNLAYRLAGTDLFPERYEDFRDLDFERVDDNFDLLEETVKTEYLTDFLSDVYEAHKIFRLTHVIVEPSFTQDDPTPMHVCGAKGGGFTCIS